MTEQRPSTGLAMRRFLPLLLLAAACAQSRSFKRFPNTPQPQPTTTTARVERAPGESVLIGTATVQARKGQSEEACAAAAFEEARRAGATHAVVRSARPGWPFSWWRGPRCTADAYYLAPR